MPAKKPLNTQPTNRLLDVSTLANSPYEKIFNPQSENIPIQQSNVFNKTSIVPQKQIQRAPSAMPNQNVVLNAGMQMLPEDQMPEEPSDDSSNFLGSLIAQGITGIGTGLMGGDSYDIMRSANVFQNMRDRQANEKRAKLLTDPKSEESKRRRLVFEKALNFKIPEEYSYTDLNDPVVLQSVRDKNMQAITPKSITSSGTPKQQGIEKSPFFKDIVTTNNMSRSVDRDMKELIDLVDRSGNTPLTGSDKFRKDQLVGKIAINYNKILDPGAVVRPEEAQAIVNQLGLDWMTKDSVTKESLQQFQKGVGDEASDRIKGYYGMYTTFDPTEQQIYDDYKKNPNDTKLKQAFENILFLKRTK
jgi:hypothetical protein